MKIINLCLANHYNIGWGYQDNLLTKYQKRLGNEVVVIASSYINDKKKVDYIETDSGIFYDNGIKVIRLKHGLGKYLTKYLRHYKDLIKTIDNEKPDFIFVHSPQFYDAIPLSNYLKKHKDIICVVDNHADYTNSAESLFAKLIHKTLWKYCANKLDGCTKRFYGTIQIRCNFLHNMYNLSKDKIDLLVMGADDDLVKKGIDNRENTREQLGINKEDFLLISGGKIDSYKTDILVLMKEINKINNPNIKLIIFGSVSPEIQEDFNNNISQNVMYIGWKNQDEIYNIICAADLGFYPGRHSVLWEQTVACGIPCVFKDIVDTHHIDIGGNCILVKDSKNIKDILKFVLNKENYAKMYENAKAHKKEQFLYSNIAKKSIECSKNL